MTSKTDTEMIYRSDTDYTFSSASTFSYLATPNTPPRTLIEYETLYNRDSDEIRRADIDIDIELLSDIPVRD